MMSAFYKNSEKVAQTADLTAFLPLGFTIPSGFAPSDANSTKGRLRIVSAHFDIAKKQMRYDVVPTA